MVPFAPSSIQAPDFRLYNSGAVFYPTARYDGFRGSDFTPSGIGGTPGSCFSPPVYKGCPPHPSLPPYNRSYHDPFPLSPVEEGGGKSCPCRREYDDLASRTPPTSKTTTESAIRAPLSTIEECTDSDVVEVSYQAPAKKDSQQKLERQLEQRRRNNEASRKSRAQKRHRYLLSLGEMHHLRLENARLRGMIVNLDEAIAEANGILMSTIRSHMDTTSFRYVS